jgi:hypothetical protein
MRRVFALIAAAMLALTGSQAAALSCMPFGIRDAYWRHADAPENYVLVHGRFSVLRDGRHDTAQDQVIWKATFTGMSASARAFDQPFSAEVTITDHLFTGIAGGDYPPDALAKGLPGLEGLVFLRETADGAAIETALCQPIIDTEPADIGPALDCLNHRNCPRPN